MHTQCDRTAVWRTAVSLRGALVFSFPPKNYSVKSAGEVFATPFSRHLETFNFARARARGRVAALDRDARKPPQVHLERRIFVPFPRRSLHSPAAAASRGC